MILILWDFADVIFRLDAMDFPESIGQFNTRQSVTGGEKDQGCGENHFQAEIRLKSEPCLSHLPPLSSDDDKHRCVTGSLSLFDLWLVIST